ncbi:MAG: tyrosine-protein kinase [Micromonosporaceae bacterium]|nr:tyrosine-protein kinase [Micromonosporaceae bacterium]MDT5038101.1 tyrosine-protein kinase [Micromonosporaceae bacterium]
MDVRSGLRLLRERWKSIIAITLLATGTGAFLTWRQTPLYSAQVTLFVSAWNGGATASSAYQDSLLSQQRVKSYTALLRGELVMRAVSEELGLGLTPAGLAAKVTATAIPDTALMAANVVDASPRRAQTIANAVAAKFTQLVPTFEAGPDGRQPGVRVTVVSPAGLPYRPISPRPVHNVGTALALGLLLGVGYAFARQQLDTTVKSAAEAAELAGAPSLGAIAADPTASKRPLVIHDGPYAPRAEAFRKIRTGLQFVDVDTAHKVVLITSSVAGEGKTTTACNLAITIAQSGKRVLLIDADLRRPRAARYLGLPGGVGLTSVLVGTAGLDDAVQGWGDDLMSVLASGPIPPNPSEILGSRHMRELLDRLRDTYDLVLIDAPPVLPVTDAATTAAACDGVVVVVRHGVTRREELTATVAALRTVDAKLLGTVLNLAPARGGDQSYQEYGARPDDGPPQQHPGAWHPQQVARQSKDRVPQ